MVTRPYEVNVVGSDHATNGLDDPHGLVNDLDDGLDDPIGGFAKVGQLDLTLCSLGVDVPTGLESLGNNERVNSGKHVEDTHQWALP